MNRDLRYFMLLSFTGGIMVLIIGLLGSSNAQEVDAWGKFLVGAPFIMSCLVGIILAIRPNWMRRRSRERKGSISDTNKVSIGIKGHHPDCGRFEDEVMKIGGRTFCAGCLGLATGAIVSILLMLAYMILPSEPSFNSLIVLLIAGLAIVSLDLMESSFSTPKIIHVMANVLLVVGFFVLVMGVFQLSGRPFYGWVVIIISFLWLETRIQIANWKHHGICSGCSEGCRVYDMTSA